jgi:hypothetical protein
MIRVYEDNGGGLHMTDSKVYASGMEHQPEPGGLIADIVSFLDWVDDASEHGDYNEIVDTVEHSTTNLIATWDGERLVLHVRDFPAGVMGFAGLRYAGIESE